MARAMPAAPHPHAGALAGPKPRNRRTGVARLGAGALAAALLAAALAACTQAPLQTPAPEGTGAPPEAAGAGTPTPAHAGPAPATAPAQPAGPSGPDTAAMPPGGAAPGLGSSGPGSSGAGSSGGALPGPAASGALPSGPAPRPSLPPAPALLTPALQPASFADLPGWADDDPRPAWPALLAGCAALRNRAEWKLACSAAAHVDAQNRWAVRKFFADYFQPYRVRALEGPAQGLVTGYYEPLLAGSRTRHGAYTVALYAPPDDLVSLDLAGFVPNVQADRLRGRVAPGADGRRSFVPYYSRAELMNGAGAASLRGKELVWVADPIEAFFLQVQGSGRVKLDDGHTVRLGYADTNGQPYRSIGRWLVERGELKLEDASMQNIRAWARANPQRIDELLAQNPSYVFFRELAVDADTGPLGALGVPLTPERSIAVDPRHVPLGAPVWLTTTEPLTSRPLRRLVFAQDTGSAIKGSLRADLYWGSGAAAGEAAGRMKQSGTLWVLLPRR